MRASVPKAIAAQMRGGLDEKPDCPAAPANFQIRRITCLCKFEGCGALQGNAFRHLPHPHPYASFLGLRPCSPLCAFAAANLA